jgi:hypothetical protein
LLLVYHGVWPTLCCGFVGTWLSISSTPAITCTQVTGILFKCTLCSVYLGQCWRWCPSFLPMKLYGRSASG